MVVDTFSKWLEVFPSSKGGVPKGELLTQTGWEVFSENQQEAGTTQAQLTAQTAVEVKGCAFQGPGSHHETILEPQQ